MCFSLRRMMMLGCCVCAAATVSCDILPFGRSAQQSYARGETLMRAGKRSDAYRFFAAAAKGDPKNAQYQWAAGSTAPSHNEAFVHFSAAWENGMKNPGVLITLVQLSFQTAEKGRIEHALELFGQLPDSLRTVEFRGDLFSMFGSSDSAVALWQQAFSASPSPVLVNKIGAAYGRAGDLDKALSFLRACKERGLLDAKGYSLLGTTYAFLDDAAQAESAFAEARLKGRYDASSLLSQAISNMALGRVPMAESLLVSIALTAIDSSNRDALLSARTLLAFLYGVRSDTAGLILLAREITGKSPIDKAEKMFIEGVLMLARRDTTGREKIRLAQRVIPDPPAVRLLMARQYASSSRFQEAIAEYRSLPPLLVRSPVIAIEYADALARAGRDDDALALLSILHQRNLISKQSLMLFRDLAFRKRLNEKAAFAQMLLEKKFGDDAQVKWSGAVMAFRAGKLDSALALFDALARQYPDEERFGRARITVLLAQEKYSEAVAACGQNPQRADLKARALAKLGKDAEARETYRQAMATSPRPQLMLDYADFLIDAGDNAAASKVLSEAIGSIGKTPGATDAVMAAMLNNYAWTSLQSGAYKIDEIQKAAEKALALDPGNPHILDTYAAILLKAGKAKQCIALLDTSKAADTTVGLLIALGKAGEQARDYNKASRAFTKAISLIDAGKGGGAAARRAELEAAVARMNAGRR